MILWKSADDRPIGEQSTRGYRCPKNATGLKPALRRRFSPTPDRKKVNVKVDLMGMIEQNKTTLKEQLHRTA